MNYEGSVCALFLTLITGAAKFLIEKSETHLWENVL